MTTLTNSALHMMEGQGARERVSAFIEVYQSRRGLDPEIIHSMGTLDGVLDLNVSDLRALCAAPKTALDHFADEVEASGEAEKHAVQTTSLLATNHTGMRVDYSGLLKQAQAGLRREPALAEMLRQLKDHLTELGRRWYVGDVAVVDEILQLYCIEKEARDALAQKPNFAIPPSNDVATLQQELALAYEGLERERRVVNQVKDAVSDYFFALDMRQHGGVAQDRAFRQILTALDMVWVQGAEAGRRVKA